MTLYWHYEFLLIALPLKYFEFKYSTPNFKELYKKYRSSLQWCGSKQDSLLNHKFIRKTRLKISIAKLKLPIFPRFFHCLKTCSLSSWIWLLPKLGIFIFSHLLSCLKKLSEVTMTPDRISTKALLHWVTLDWALKYFSFLMCKMRMLKTTNTQPSVTSG